jgi:ribosomal-protein-alanine N-acetyltransferase
VANSLVQTAFDAGMERATCSIESQKMSLKIPEVELVTARLRLRPWQAEDREPFARLNADPEVMRHFPGVMTREQSDTMVDRICEHFASYGYGFWAVSRLAGGPCLGMVGLRHVQFEAHFTPCLEVGWRLAAEHWGQGFATEAAQAALNFAFGDLQQKEVVAFTVPANQASRRVMEKLGMTHSPAENFEHPALPEGHPLREHVLYRMPCTLWELEGEH